MEKLGIEPKLLLAQIVNFLVIMIVLTRLLFKPILAILEKRRKEIREGLAITDRMKQEEEKLETRKDKLLQEARSQARVIIEEAKKQGKVAERDIVDAAHKDAQELLRKAGEQAEALHASMLVTLRRETVELAGAMAKRLVSAVLSAQDQHRLIEKHLKEFEVHAKKQVPDIHV